MNCSGGLFQTWSLLQSFPSEKVLVHYEGYGATQSRLIALMSGADPGNSY